MTEKYLTLDNIVNWIDEWAVNHQVYSETELIVFAEGLNEKIGQMNFKASNGGVAIGYAGVIGDRGGNSGVFKTVEKLVEGSNGHYSFINYCAENIQNNSKFEKALKNAILKEHIPRIMGGRWIDDGNRLRTSFGNALSINDFVSDNYMLKNARGKVQLIITDKARFDSVLNVTELERLLTMDEVTHINDIPKAELIKMDSLSRFKMLKEQSVLGLINAKVFENTDGVEILSLEGTKFKSLYPGKMPEGFTESRLYLTDYSDLYYDVEGRMLGAFTSDKAPTNAAYTFKASELEVYTKFGLEFTTVTPLEKMANLNIDKLTIRKLDFEEITNTGADSTRYLMASRNTLSLNDLVSNKCLLDSIQGEVHLIISDKELYDSSLHSAKIEQLLNTDKVSHINGVQKTELQKMGSEKRFNMLKEQSVLGLNNASVYVNSEGVKILSLEGTTFQPTNTGNIPSGYKTCGKYLTDQSELFYDGNGNLLGVFTSDKAPEKAVLSVNIGEFKDFACDADVSIEFGAEYENFTPIEKMQAKQIDY